MKLFNNLTRKLEEFQPIKANQVNVYSCGPTVYDHSHIGHARSGLVWDLLYRYLRYKGYQVNWIRNITNVDDKIVKRAAELVISPDMLSRAMTYEFWQDMVALNVSWPTYEPRATDYLPQMFNFIQALIDKDLAYVVDGDVYFRVAKHKAYGQLKGQSLTELREGLARVEGNDKKQDQLDFALWKSFTESAFQSPWGLGRPGWHLECSTMIAVLLSELGAGDTLDIHAGGDDLLHPHHENECAQSESLTGKPLAKYWLHNGMVMLNGSKMSKSDGNFLTIKELLQTYKANTIRYFCLSTHYKKQLNFSHEALAAAESGLDKLFAVIKPRLSELADGFDKKGLVINNSLLEQFTRVMDDDLGSPKALALLFDNKQEVDTVICILDILGFNLFAELGSKASSDKVLAAALDLLMEMRYQARLNKDFATSDKIRDRLIAAGVTIKDHKDKASEWVLE